MLGILKATQNTVYHLYQTINAILVPLPKLLRKFYDFQVQVGNLGGNATLNILSIEDLMQKITATAREANNTLGALNGVVVDAEKNYLPSKDALEKLECSIDELKNQFGPLITSLGQCQDGLDKTTQAWSQTASTAASILSIIQEMISEVQGSMQEFSKSLEELFQEVGQINLTKIIGFSILAIAATTVLCKAISDFYDYSKDKIQSSGRPSRKQSLGDAEPDYSRSSLRFHSMGSATSVQDQGGEGLIPSL